LSIWSNFALNGSLFPEGWRPASGNKVTTKHHISTVTYNERKRYVSVKKLEGSMNSRRTLEIAQSLVAFDSVSGRSNGPISDWVEGFLVDHGFVIERLEYRDANSELKVNLVAKRLPRKGLEQGGVCYLAHTDVVPADDWACDFCGPFEPTVREGRLYGRGSCDMKGSLACALAAVETILVQDQKAPLYFVVTADEEISMLGAQHVANHSRLFKEMVRANTIGIIGEPTELRVIHSHKGGQAFKLTARGRSAHSSSRDGINANYALIPVLPKLMELYQRTENDRSLQNSSFDPPTLSWNMVIRNQPFASNVTPSLAEVVVFLRPMPNVDHTPLVNQVADLANEFGLEFSSRESCPPLYVDPQLESIAGMLELTGHDRSETVCYATDGSSLQELKHLVVCGPGSIQQAHRHDEWIALEQLERGTDLYLKAFRRWGC
jgi:acetylornithine deacetylase